MSIGDYYTETVILLDKDSSTGGYWSTSTGAEYSTAASIQAGINQLSASEISAYGKIGIDARYKAYCEVTSEVYGGRRCRWDGDTFEIVEAPKNTLQKGHHYRFLIRDVNNA